MLNKIIFLLAVFYSKFLFGYAPWEGAYFQGESKNSVLWIDVYTGKLWTNKQALDLLFKDKIALELQYHRDFEGREIARKSVEELRKQGIEETKLVLWEIWMNHAFPNVQAGDTLAAIYDPNVGVTFVYNKKNKTFESSDREFAQSFMKIWLSSTSSNTHLYKLLQVK